MNSSTHAPTMRHKRLAVVSTFIALVFLSLFYLSSHDSLYSPIPEPEIISEDPQQTGDPALPSSYAEFDFSLPKEKLAAELFSFPRSSRPKWLSTPAPQSPLVFRIAIITHPRDFDKRDAVRKYTLSNVPTSACKFSYRFILGYGNEAEDKLVLEEMHKYGDIVRLDMKEDKRRMGEKRWRMLRWAAEEHRGPYDYFLSLDTDAFVRLHALALRTRAMHPEFKPREESIMWAQVQEHKVHFVANPVDNEETVLLEDDKVFKPEEFNGPVWYPYPIGFAYLMSSHLVARLMDPEVKLAHHVSFPSDDVMVGMWVSEWATDTKVIRDKTGFHDPPGHNYHPEDTEPITWDSVVLHHVAPWEFRELRRVKEWKGEWLKTI
ncbi:galactosyltransferase-domain-containing protein [Pterulicium gracile]|uniref:Hexosyltransferase n=1 Tax=Pterulicium gracile TaxID=1884261 RepID=A0A5C3QLH9_9AGAR|nr:galactosyltransferase-domain-containing protein [Pterula gracilis]